MVLQFCPITKTFPHFLWPITADMKARVAFFFFFFKKSCYKFRQFRPQNHITTCIFADTPVLFFGSTPSKVPVRVPPALYACGSGPTRRKCKCHCRYMVWWPPAVGKVLQLWPGGCWLDQLLHITTRTQTETLESRNLKPQVITQLIVFQLTLCDPPWLFDVWGELKTPRDGASLRNAATFVGGT